MKKEELEQLVRNLESENSKLKNEIYFIKQEKDTLSKRLKDANTEILQLHIVNERRLTDIIYGLITHTNTEIEKCKKEIY